MKATDETTNPRMAWSLRHISSPRRGEEGPQAPSSSSRKVVGKLMPSKSAEVAKPHRLRLPLPLKAPPKIAGLISPNHQMPTKKGETTLGQLWPLSLPGSFNKPWLMRKPTMPQL